MFLEINDMSTGSLVVEPLNMLSVDSVYIKQAGSKYQLFYKLNNGLIRMEEFDTQTEANNRLDEVKEMSIGGGTNVYTYKGSCLFANKPSSGQVAGDVWNIEDDFTLDGKNYPAGTNIAWDGTGWDPLAGSMVVGGLEFKGICTMSGTSSSNAILFDSKEPGIYFFCTGSGGANSYENVYVKGTSSDTGTHGLGGGMAIVVIVKSFNDAVIDETFAYSYGSPMAGITTASKNIQRSIIPITKASSTTIGMPSVITRKLSKDNIDYIDMDQTISAKKTFSTLPETESSADITTAYQLPNKKYVDKLLAAEYDATATYAVGDYVYHSNGLYVCNTAIETAEAWTAAHWTQVTPYIYNDLIDYVDSQVGNINTLLGGI